MPYVVANALLFRKIPPPAFADALVENAQKLWEGEIAANYALMVDNLESGKINAAKDPAAKLQDLTVRMAAEVAKIREQAAALAPELGNAWTDTEQLMNNFNKRVIFSRSVIGKGQVDLNALSQNWSAAYEAFKKSVEFTKAFGKRYGEIIGGPVESAKELCDGYLNEGYRKTIEYLEAENTDDGKVEIDRLIEIIARLYTFTGTASSQFADLAQPLRDMWRPAHEATNQFQEQAEEVSELVGESEYELDDMQDAYGDLDAEITRAYKDVWDFGTRLRAISDNWG